MRILFFAPVIVGVIDILIAIAYVFIKDYPRVVYWLSAAILTGSTLLMK